MMTLDDFELRSVIGGAARMRVPGTTIFAVPPKEAVCNRAQFDWMAERMGNGVQSHVVAADSQLCGFPMPGRAGTSAPEPGAPSDSAAGKFLNMPGATDLDFFKFLR